jgi:hypothetical protein
MIMIDFVKKFFGLSKKEEESPQLPPLPERTLKIIARKSEGVPGTVILLIKAAKMMTSELDFSIFADLLPGSDEIWLDYEARAEKAKSNGESYSYERFIQEKAAEFNAA